MTLRTTGSQHPGEGPPHRGDHGHSRFCGNAVATIANEKEESAWAAELPILRSYRPTVPLSDRSGLAAHRPTVRPSGGLQGLIRGRRRAGEYAICSHCIATAGSLGGS